jgi:chromate transport protein ChrA
VAWAPPWRCSSAASATSAAASIKPSPAKGFAFTRALPGSTGIQLVAYLSHRLYGWSGTLVGTIAYIAPATLLIIVAAALPSRCRITAAKRRAHGGSVFLACTARGFFVNAVLVIVLAGSVGTFLTKEEKARA